MGSSGGASGSGQSAVTREVDLDEAGSSTSISHHIIPSEVAELIAAPILPGDYSYKVCDLCGETSLSQSPFQGQGHADGAAWGSLLPWAAGKMECPKGRLCRRVSC
jgi:hypothetical protein